MADQDLAEIMRLLEHCSPDERKSLFDELRATQVIHEYEKVVGAPAEMILEAIHRAPELTRRMLRGVIADAAFARFMVPALARSGWTDITPEGNWAYDYKVQDGKGDVTIQVKLQRSLKGEPVVKDGTRYGFAGDVFITETQKTRGGKDGDDKLTRPYRYGEFDVLAVSMQPSSGKWDQYMFTVGKWLIAGKGGNEIAVMQPVTMGRSEFWTDDFSEAAHWFREDSNGKRMKARAAVRGKRAPSTNLFDL